MRAVRVPCALCSWDCGSEAARRPAEEPTEVGSAVRFFCICVSSLAFGSGDSGNSFWLFRWESDSGTTLYRDIPEEIRELVEPLTDDCSYG